jgi:hypothetical protein
MELVKGWNTDFSDLGGPVFEGWTQGYECSQLYSPMFRLSTLYAYLPFLAVTIWMPIKSIAIIGGKAGYNQPTNSMELCPFM